MGRNESQNEREMKRKRRYIRCLIRHVIDEITMEILSSLHDKRDDEDALPAHAKRNIGRDGQILLVIF